MNDLNSARTAYERKREAAAKLSRANKHAVFDALEAAGITHVLVEFDGSGDQGQIESVIASRVDQRVELPETQITIQNPSCSDTGVTTVEQTLAEAIETLCYDLLDEEHDGWQDNEGAFGEFHFDVAARTIELHFNARYLEVSNSFHEF